MKTLLRILLSVVGLIALVILGAYADGATMPVDHSVSISGDVNAPPEKVFTRITDIAGAPKWRPEVQSVEVLPKDNTRDAWVEDLGHNMKMKFLATTTVPPDATGHAVRKVKLDDPSYGGTWTYEISPGPTPGTTHLKITEDGFIIPPFYRFLMAHIFGPTKNLQDYMNHMQAAEKG
jgi:uncharacterized protein YndB with AHSA1/START domain